MSSTKGVPAPGHARPLPQGDLSQPHLIGPFSAEASERLQVARLGLGHRRLLSRTLQPCLLPLTREPDAPLGGATWPVPELRLHAFAPRCLCLQRGLVCWRQGFGVSTGTFPARCGLDPALGRPWPEMAGQSSAREPAVPQAPHFIHGSPAPAPRCVPGSRLAVVPSRLHTLLGRPVRKPVSPLGWACCHLDLPVGSVKQGHLPVHRKQLGSRDENSCRGQYSDQA